MKLMYNVPLSYRYQGFKWHVLCSLSRELLHSTRMPHLSHDEWRWNNIEADDLRSISLLEYDHHIKKEKNGLSRSFDRT